MNKGNIGLCQDQAKDSGATLSPVQTEDLAGLGVMPLDPRQMIMILSSPFLELLAVGVRQGPGLCPQVTMSEKRSSHHFDHRLQTLLEMQYYTVVSITTSQIADKADQVERLPDINRAVVLEIIEEIISRGLKQLFVQIVPFMDDLPRAVPHVPPFTWQ